MNRALPPSRVLRSGACTIAVVAFIVGMTSCGVQMQRSAAAHADLSAARVATGAKTSETSALARHTRVRNVPQSTSYPGFGATLDPPGNAKPVVTASEAIALCGKAGSQVSCEPGQPDSIELGILSDPGMGIDQRLVWAISWDAVNCMVLGPYGQPSSPPSFDATGCNFVSMVDATTGVNPMAMIGAGI